jgi:P-type Cu2+ transporter
MDIHIKRNMEIINQENHNTVVPVTGMSCASCAIGVEDILSKQAGVLACSVNFANESAKISYNPAETSLEKLQKALSAVGYGLLLSNTSTTTTPKATLATHKATKQQSQKHNLIWASAFTFPVFVIGMFLMDMPYGNYISWALSTPVVWWFGRHFFVQAFRLVRFGKFSMDTLVALSTGIAYFFSVFNTLFPAFWHTRGIHPHVYFEASSVVIVFVMLGKWLEENAKANTSNAIEKLIGLQPTVVRVVENGEEIDKAIEAVGIGERILVRPGEKVALDGKVVSGSSFIDESMITIPVEKSRGSQVFAGTVNQQGVFQFVAQKVGSETLLAQIIKLVQEAQGSKAPIQRLVDTIAGVFVPVVMGISVLTFVIWLLIGGEQSFAHGLLAAITVLVIACPCALGLATPTAIMVGVGKGAAQGILIKDAESLEQIHRINAVVLDKTGTITEGKPTVVSAEWKTETDIATLQSILMGIENQSTHPLANAIVAYFKAQKVKPSPIQQLENKAGMGVVATVNDQRYYVGSWNWVHSQQGDKVARQQDSKATRQQVEMLDRGYSIVAFASSSEVLAVIGIDDHIKDSSAEAMSLLHQKGIETYMLTGDNLATAQKVASAVGIEQVRASQLPNDKAEFIKTLQAQGKVVAMVGDGINDSQALALADVSIAMGKGSDIAIDVAKITLISSDLRQVAHAIALSKATLKTIHQNLFWAFIYNLIGIPLAAGVLYPINEFLLNPMIAGAAMALSSVSVVGNSLRLYRSVEP